jgi:hypothetical protein
MKGSVLRLLWPAPAATKAASQLPKDPTRRQTTPDLDAQGERPVDPFNEITLAVLEEFSAVKARGYDPYNTSAAARRLPADGGQRKRKRD